MLKLRSAEGPWRIRYPPCPGMFPKKSHFRRGLWRILIAPQAACGAPCLRKSRQRCRAELWKPLPARRPLWPRIIRARLKETRRSTVIHPVGTRLSFSSCFLGTREGQSAGQSLTSGNTGLSALSRTGCAEFSNCGKPFVNRAVYLAPLPNRTIRTVCAMMTQSNRKDMCFR